MRCDAGRIHTPRAPLLYYRSNQVGFPTSHIPTNPRRAARGLANANAVYAAAVYSNRTVPYPTKKEKNSTVLYCTVYRIFFATPLARLPNSEDDTLPLTVLQNRKNPSFPRRPCPCPFFACVVFFFFRALLCHGCFRVCVSPGPPSLPILRARTGRDRKRYPYLLLNKIRWRWTLLCVYLFWPSPQVSSDVV